MILATIELTASNNPAWASCWCRQTPATASLFFWQRRVIAEQGKREQWQERLLIQLLAGRSYLYESTFQLGADMQTVSSALERFVYAVRELSGQWYPIQSQTSAQIISNFETGKYACSRTHLSRDIRQDPGLYLYCIKELAPRMSGRNHTPLDLLYYAPLESVFEVIQSAPVSHSLDQLQRFQADCLKQSMIAAVTSELLAPSVAIDPELGYTCSLLRQLGYSLAAWNYPEQYAKALSYVDEHHSLEEMLRESLGFSPRALGTTYARDWQLCPEIQEALKILPENQTSDTPFASREQLTQYDSPGNKLRKVCAIGEKLARAMQPESYLNGAKALQSAHVELVRHLGNDAIKHIWKTASERLVRYNNYDVRIPAVASAEELKKVVSASVQADEWKKQNIHLPKLEETLRTQLSGVYRLLNGDTVSREAITRLCKEIIPNFGFSDGYVYLLSPRTNHLNASLTIGTPSTHSPKKIALGLAINDRLLCTSAFNLKTPLRTEFNTPEISAGRAYAGRLGKGQAIGVLYLESTKERLSCHTDDPMLRFQALQQCIAAALHAL